MNSIFDLLQLLSSAAAAGLLVAAFFPAGTGRRKIVLIIVCTACLAIKADHSTIAACIRGFTGNFSVTSIVLIVVGCARVIAGRKILNGVTLTRYGAWLTLSGAMFGIVLYLSAFGVLAVDLYRYGYDFRIAGAALLLAALLALSQSLVPAAVVLLVFAAYGAGLFPGNNLADCLFDVPLWLFCICRSFSLLRAGVPRRNAGSGKRGVSGILLLAGVILSIGVFSPAALAVDYQEEGRLQSADTLPPEGAPCPECNVANDTADKPPAKKASADDLPVTVYADRLFYDKKTGSVAAAVFDEKSVIVEYKGNKLTAEAIFGNINNGKGFIPGDGRVIGDRINVTGKDIYVDEKNRVANVKAFEGKISSSYFSGESADITANKITVYNSIVTSCPANIPDYHISAERMEIFPNDRMILYNAHIFLKNYEIASMREFSVVLGSKKENYIPYPSVGWWSDTGFWVNEEISIPLFVNQSYLNVDLAYYQKFGFAPNASVSYNNDYFNAELLAGFERDDQGNWIKKLPDLELSSKRMRIGKLPISFTASGSSGIWVSTTQQSFHNTLQAYFQGDKIDLPWDMGLSIGTGALGVWDGPQQALVFSDVPQAAKAFNATVLVDSVLNKKFSDSLSGALEFHYQRQQTQIFDFNNPNATCAGVWGIQWQPFEKDNISVRQTLNLATFSQTQLDTTWSHNWHCWNTILTYHWSTGIIEFNMPMASW